MEQVPYIVVVFVVAFLVTYITVPFSKWIAYKIGALDHPGKRRINTTVIPRCGGISLYLGLLTGCGILYIGCNYLGWRAFDLYTTASINPMLLLCGISAMFATGLVDDIVQLRASTKFAFQILSAGVVVMAGISIDAIRSFGGTYIELGLFDTPLTILYLVVFVNVINLTDGMDGLASGITAICAVGLLYLVWMRGSFTLSMACIALVAVCIAFLRHNFYPATIFMGDSGALLLGLVLGIISVTGVVRTQSLIVMVVPFVIASVPILDTCAAIVRRRRKHVSIGQADKEHVHHRLLDTGMGQIRTAITLYGITACMVLAGCALSNASGYARVALLVALAIIAFLITWHLGISERVVRHHYDNRGKTGPRIAPEQAQESRSQLEPLPKQTEAAPTAKFDAEATVDAV